MIKTMALMGWWLLVTSIAHIAYESSTFYFAVGVVIAVPGALLAGLVNGWIKVKVEW